MTADLWQDLRYGARMLLKQKGVTAIALLSLALGIGACGLLHSGVAGDEGRPTGRAPARLIRFRDALLFREQL